MATLVTAKQVVHYVPSDPGVLFHPSVLFCTSGTPWNPQQHFDTVKTMVVHDRTTLVSGTTHKCANCNTTWSSQ